MDLTQFIRDVPDFPKPGIVFKDIAPLLGDAAALKASVDGLADLVANVEIDKVVGIESRGFIFGVPLAIQLDRGFVPVRKPNKLPWKTHSMEYELEYGTDTLEIHVDGVGDGDRVLIVDDLLATGGTLAAACDLVEMTGATVAACVCVVELAFLEGRKKLKHRPCHTLLSY